MVASQCAKVWALKSAAIDLQPLAQKYAQDRGLIWLDSSANMQRLGRYSYLCIDPVESIPAAANIDDLRFAVGRYSSGHINEGPPFQGGLVGFFDYEFSEPNSQNALKYYNQTRASCHFRLYDTIIAVDHHADLTWIISSGFKSGAYRPCRRIAQAKINAVRRDIRNLPSPPTSVVPLVWRNQISKSTYLRAVNDILDFIRAGDIYQANFAQTFVANLPRSTDPFQVYLSIRKSNPAPFSVYGSFGERSIACTSPERLITVNGGGMVEARPIKGTIARSDDPEEDRQLKDRLLKSKKDRAENIMIVDLLRNDLSKVCKPHSVEVSELCTLESYAGLHQLTSSVRGQLGDELDAFNLLSAVFPGGSVTGAPKCRAMEIIDHLEQNSRRAFCGSFGYFGFNGTADFNIMIRTIQFDGDRARLDVGSGITSLSNPNEEYSETLLKAQKILCQRGRSGCPMILLLDNRDSFVFNLSRYFQELGEATKVVDSDKITLDDVEAMDPKALVISPGPCTPNEAGISMNVVSHFSGRLPILGVCLGHLAIAQSYGGVVTNSLFPEYGQASPIMHNGCDLFEGLPNPLNAGLYHSLIVEKISETDLIVQAKSIGGEIMALRHKDHPTFGIQFHPESILSEAGHELLQNFLLIAEKVNVLHRAIK